MRAAAVIAAANLTPEERARVRRLFVMLLCKLQRFDLYWVPSQRRITARSLAAVKRWRVPAGARLIGRYCHPFPADDFLGDLDDVTDHDPGAGAARA